MKHFDAGRKSIGGNWCVLEHFLGFQSKFQYYRFLTVYCSGMVSENGMVVVAVLVGIYKKPAKLTSDFVIEL